MSLDREIEIKILPESGYKYFHLGDIRGCEYQGDGIVELPCNTIVIFDVSLGSHVIGDVEDQKGVILTESLIGSTFEKYLKDKYSHNMLVLEVVGLGAKFLRDRVVNQILTDFGLSVTACKIGEDFSKITMADFGSNIVFGPNGRRLIGSKRVFDPWINRETTAVTKKLDIKTVQIAKVFPFLMATDGFSPPLSWFWGRFSMAKEGYPLEKFTNPEFFHGEALVVKIDQLNDWLTYQKAVDN